MNPTKQAYLQRIRSQSSYPTFRSLIGIFALLLYILGAVCILGGIIGGLGAMAKQGASGLVVIVVGFIAGAIYIIMGKVVREASSMLADIADSVTDLNSRYEQQPPSA
jgi:hypothetical protein